MPIKPVETPTYIMPLKMIIAILVSGIGIWFGASEFSIKLYHYLNGLITSNLVK
jgi:hypothetical protein